MQLLRSSIGKLRWYAEPRLLRFWWEGVSGSIIEISSGWAFALQITRHDHDDCERNLLHIHLGWPNIFITLPGRYPYRSWDEGFGKAWGVAMPDRHAIHFNWGNKTKIYWSPFIWESIRHEVQRADGSWALYEPTYGRFNKDLQTWLIGEPDGRHVMQFPYTYVLRHGEKQETIADVHVERSFLRRRFLKWTRFGQKVARSINVTFKDEIGERAGSWKGGCVGCSYSMLPNEDAEATLRRMERERKFR